MACFEDKIATKCIKCKKVLSSGGVTFRGEPWHKVGKSTIIMIMIMIPRKECFVCARCEVQLAGQKFASREDKPYCADCFGEVMMMTMMITVISTMMMMVRCSPRGVRPAPSPSLARAGRGSYHLKAATGTATVSCAPSVNSPWPAK